MSGGFLMQLTPVQEFVQADDVDTAIAYYMAIASGALLIFERLMVMYNNSQESRLKRYERKKEIDEKYKR